MKKSAQTLSFFIFLTTLVASCDFFRKGDPVGSISEVDADAQYRDSTIYGACGKATSMNSLQLITDTGDTLVLSLVNAQEAGMVLGGIKAGERMAVVANADSTEAAQVINISTLLGDWVMEDPIDGSGEVGISIKDGGVAESINHTTIQYQSWRLLNGDLEITNTRDDGVDFEETYRYKLIYLGPDSLVFQETEKPVNETRAELFEYTRQKPKEHYDPGFELEDSKFEDFVF